jgi:ABC-2 type transport system ATP-binding protein
MDEVAIRVENVSKDFLLPHEKVNSVKGLFTGITQNSNRKKEKQHALKDISFEINKGEFFGIVGRNGSGKSTLLKILANIYQPTSGKVYTKGKLVPFIELGVGFNPELSGRENVYLNGAMLGFSEKEVDAMYDDIVSFAELKRFMDQKLKNYSSGMQVRLAFSMAVRAEADILLIDEVLAVGDADFQRKCYDYFKTLKKNKKTVVFVSHDMSAIKEFCDRGILVEKGELVSSGDSRAIADAYSDLFMEESSEKDLNKLKTNKRSGDGTVLIKQAELDKASYSNKDSSLNMVITAESHGVPSQLMIGFAVRNSQGLIINSSHTWDYEIVLPQLSPGESLTTRWHLPNIYEDGLYTIDVYSFGSNHEVYDRIEDAISFRCKRRNRSGALITLPVDIEVGKPKKAGIK